MDRIISKEEEREDPRRDSSIYLRVQNTGVFPQFYKNYTKSNIPTSLPVIPCYSTYIINSSTRILQEILQLQGSSHVIPCRLLPATVPRVSKHSTRQNKAPSSPTAFQGHTAQAGFQLILPGRNSILSGRQHPHSPYSSSQVHSYRILPGEIGSFPKGRSIVYPCNTKVSVFQFTCYKNINSIQSSSNSMQRYSTLSSIQVILVAILHKLQ